MIASTSPRSPMDDSRQRGASTNIGIRVEKATTPWMGEVERRRKPKLRARGYIKQ